MEENTLVESLKLPKKVAENCGYFVDWSTAKSVNDSIRKMDRMSQLFVKCAIDLASLGLTQATRRELIEAGIKPSLKDEDLLKIIGGNYER